MTQPRPLPLQPTTDAPRLAVTAAEVARLLQCSQRHVERLDARGRLPAPVRIGRSKRWALAEIQNWLAADCPDRRTWNARRAMQGERR